MNKINIFFLMALVVLIFSCAKKSANPTGPAIETEDPNFGDFVKVETWIADFDNGPKFFKWRTNNVWFSNEEYYDGSSIHYIDPALQFSMPLHYYISAGSSAYLDSESSEGVAAITLETNNNIVNAFIHFEYRIGDEPSGDWEWFSLKIFWASGTIDANKFGNAFAFKARGTGKMDAILTCTENTKSKLVSLSQEWQEYIVLFSDMALDGDLSQCTGFSFSPPSPSDKANIGISGYVEFDDVRFVLYYQKK